MKKIFIIIAVTFVVVNSNAQWFLGGNIGLSLYNDKEKSDNETGNNGTGNMNSISFEITPKGGYYFNEKIALGLGFSTKLGFSKTVGEDIDHKHEYKANSIRWSIFPFVKYSVYTYKRFSLILDISIGCGSSKSEEIIEQEINTILREDKRQSSIIGIDVLNLTPILGFKLNDHFQLEAGLNFLNLRYNIDIKTETTNRTTTETTTGITTSDSFKTTSTKHDFNIGFNTSNILSVSQLTIGVIYKF